ncbi:hypothetical protein MASR2M66_12630 [Chloroflexota bacterium]
MLEHPRRLLLTAVLLLLFGCIMPFLMVIHVVKSTFFLNFLSFGASMLGFFIGIVGIAMQRLQVREKKKKDDFYD